MNLSERPRLEYYFVTFIDILGFSNMVEKDCNGPPDNVYFLPKLIDLYESMQKNRNDAGGLSFTQFSDSIVLSQRYSAEGFRDFAEQVISFQHTLLIQGVLCRGGLSYGKHYERANLLFSEALIKAYELENQQARYPRIVIDNDLIDLLSPRGMVPSPIIVREADGALFLDYLALGTVEQNHTAVQALTVGWEQMSINIREKLRWLREYFSFHYPENNDLSIDRFKRI